MSKLGDMQRRFAKLVPRLIDQAHVLGFEVTLGDVYRDPRVFGMVGDSKGYGSRNSNHKQRLAIDLNLFKNGEYQATSEAHRPLGEWWEEQDSSAVWGGDFADGNHYSFEYNGYK